MVAHKRQWIWNIVIGLTIMVCLSAFVLHSKNWIREEEDGFVLLTGFYFSEVRYDEIQTVDMVERIPEMERKSGFSVWGVEKGIFRDTLEGVEGIRVYVDELKYPKIRLQQKESPPIYFNFGDSTKTDAFLKKISDRLGNAPID
jgi:hypothetical protein